MSFFFLGSYKHVLGPKIDPKMRGLRRAEIKFVIVYWPPLKPLATHIYILNISQMFETFLIG